MAVHCIAVFPFLVISCNIQKAKTTTKPYTIAASHQFNCPLWTKSSQSENYRSMKCVERGDHCKLCCFECLSISKQITPVSKQGKNPCERLRVCVFPCGNPFEELVRNETHAHSEKKKQKKTTNNSSVKRNSHPHRRPPFPALPPGVFNEERSARREK